MVLQQPCATSDADMGRTCTTTDTACSRGPVVSTLVGVDSWDDMLLSRGVLQCRDGLKRGEFQAHLRNCSEHSASSSDGSRFSRASCGSAGSIFQTTTAPYHGRRYFPSPQKLPATLKVVCRAKLALRLLSATFGVIMRGAVRSLRH